MKSSASTLWILQVIFIVLQLLGLISWSWWAVLIPIFIMAGLFVVAVLLGLVGVALAKAAGPATSRLRGRQ